MLSHVHVKTAIIKLFCVHVSARTLYYIYKLSCCPGKNVDYAIYMYSNGNKYCLNHGGQLGHHHHLSLYCPSDKNLSLDHNRTPNREPLIVGDSVSGRQPAAQPKQLRDICKITLQEGRLGNVLALSVETTKALRYSSNSKTFAK